MSTATPWPRLNLAAGPVQVMDQTLRDAARPVLYHYDPAFIELFARTSELLKQVFRTNYDVVIMQGEAILGLEAAAAGLLSPGDKVLNLVSGVFGKWFEDFIHKYGGGPVGLSTLGVVVGEEAGTLEDVYEPFLIQQGFIKRTSRGREATALAYRHLGLEPPQGLAVARSRDPVVRERPVEEQPELPL